MRRREVLVACLLPICLLLGRASPAAAAGSAPFRFWKEIDRGPARGEDILTVPLDAEIYAAVRAGLPDLRVLDDAEAESPYQIEAEGSAAYLAAAFDVKEDAVGQETVVQVRTRCEPLTSFTLQTSSRNFSRRAVVETRLVHEAEMPLGRQSMTQWTPIGEATLANVHFRDNRREQLRVTFPEQRQDEYRIVIHNEDNPPLEIHGVHPEGNVYRLVFLAQPSKKYRVFYGSATVASPKYEAATVLAELGGNYRPVAAKLGPQIANAAFAEETDSSVRGALENWVFLGAAVGLMVAVLAWGLIRAGKQLEELPKE
jgi:hypothetical protein